MLAILPLLNLVLWFFVFSVRSSNARFPEKLGGAWIHANILFGIEIVLITEILSACGCLKQSLLVGVWILLAIPPGYLLLVAPDKSRYLRGASVWIGMALLRTKPVRLLFMILMTLVVAILITALFAAPNNWDSMTYHLARIAHWTQNQSVRPFPTSIDRQLYQPPFAEFTIAHLQILSGSDEFAAIVQFGAMIGSLVAVALIARRISEKPWATIGAVVFCATLPMGILQGSSTQNDYVVTFWLASFAYLIMSGADSSWILASFAGAAFGLALLTKGTAYLFCLPLALTFALAIYRNRSGIHVSRIAFILAIAIVINAPHYARNIAVFGRPLTPQSLHYEIERWSPGTIASNVMRNIALHAGAIPGSRYERVVYDFVVSSHQVFHLDVEDPATTWMGSKFRVGMIVNHEDLAGNPLHLALIALVGISGIVSILRGKRRLSADRSAETQAILPLGLLLLATALVSVAMLKWQPWNSRLHLPFFVLAAPLVGATIAAQLSTIKVNLLNWILIFSGLPFAFYNMTRPLVASLDLQTLRQNKLKLTSKNIWNTPRSSMYFLFRPDIESDYRQIAAALIANLDATGCREIGLVLGEDDWEYPLHVLSRRNESFAFRFEHIEVRNPSGALSGSFAFRDFHPCAIVATAEEWDARRERVPESDRLIRYLASGRLGFYTEKN